MRHTKGSALLFTILLIPLLVSVIMLATENIVQHERILSNYRRYFEAKMR